MSNPNLPDDFEMLKLQDCYPYIRLYEEFADRIDEDGVLDYDSADSREALDAVHEELHKLGFRQHEITTSAAIALGDLNIVRAYVDYVQEPGDLFAQA